MSLRGVLLSFGLLLVAMGVHEFARAWVADKLGAISTRYPNRLTLNPIAHFNLMGMIILPLVFL